MNLDRLRITVLSAPLDEPVPMSFSQLASRDMVLVEVEADGVVGIGESWVNYPAWAATERVATLARGVVPLLAGVDVTVPGRVQDHLVRGLGGVARQWGAPGPIWQALSSVDVALWDLTARQRGVSVANLLCAGVPRSHVDAYASGIGPTGIEEHCKLAVEAGYRAVKARVGFGRATDEETLARTRAAVGPDVTLFVDANQAWSVPEALDFCDWSKPYAVSWLEEPLTGNRLEDLATLAETCPLPLACGENLYGLSEFTRYTRSGTVALIQPDLAKSGGFTLAAALASGLPPRVRLAPHSYGGAVVTAASVQLAAAYPHIPYLELDARPNPLREDILTRPLTAAEGRIAVPEGPGLGVDLDWDTLDRYIVERKDCDLRAALV